jgi:hypothetical protein
MFGGEDKKMRTRMVAALFAAILFTGVSNGFGRNERHRAWINSPMPYWLSDFPVAFPGANVGDDLPVINLSGFVGVQAGMNNALASLNGTIVTRPDWDKWYDRYSYSYFASVPAWERELHWYKWK